MQQRQAYHFKSPSLIYPVIPATAATLLKEKGHRVIWRDCVAEMINQEQYFNLLNQNQPDWIFWEVKTPTVKKTWDMVDKVKRLYPYINIGLFGDHVSALPQETLELSFTDTVLVGGNIDFGIIDLLAYCAVAKTPKIWKCPRVIPKEIPPIDRELTKWRFYGTKNGNFKHPAGTYTQFGRDCWWRKDKGCTFCSWTTTFPNYSAVSTGSAIREVENCMHHGVREIFDDSGTFPPGQWLWDFTSKLKKINKRGLHGHRIRFGCNIRANGFGKDDYHRMYDAGFRFVLLGMESANQATLDRLNKGETVWDMENALKLAKLARLEPHITIMVGYPWESREDALNTLDTARGFFSRGLIRSLQATVCVPYPGTRLFEEAKVNDWLRTYDWNEYDMSDSVFRLGYDVKPIIRAMYKASMHPMNIVRRVLSIRTPSDFSYLMRSAKYVLNHLEDFR